MHSKSRVSITAKENERIGFVVTQQHVIAWLIKLDVVMLKQERFCLGMGYRHVDMLDERNQSFRFTAGKIAPEVARQAFFQIFGFTNINNRLTGVIHTIDARLAGYCLEKSSWVKDFTHY